jgi:putative protein-disulfide isomerase
MVAKSVCFSQTIPIESPAKHTRQNNTSKMSEKTNNQNTKTPNVEIIYLYDAMCGWCYGFSPVITALEEKYRNKVKFTVLSGGMVLGERKMPAPQLFSYIGNAYLRVEKLSGVTFGKPYLEGIMKDSSYILSSEMPSLAMTVFKSFQPEKAVQFAAALQKIFFLEGKSLNDIQTYLDLASKFGINTSDFASRMQNPAFQQDTEAEFALVGRFGVSGFPTVVLKKEDKYYLISNGYTSLKEADKTIQKLIE